MKTLTDYCRDFILERLPLYVNQSIYGSQLPIKITEGINRDGTCTFSSDEAVTYIKEWWGKCGEYSSYERQNQGMMTNPFLTPELFMTRMITVAIDHMIVQCDNGELKNIWEKKSILTKDIITSLTASLKRFRGEIYF